MSTPAMPAMAATRTVDIEDGGLWYRVLVGLLVLWVAGCAQPDAPPASTQGPADDVGGGVGTVTEVLNAGRYLYFCIDQGGRGLWLATEFQDLRLGDRVRFQHPLLMRQFHSKALGRVFAEILFVSQVEIVDRPAVSVQPVAGLPSGHPLVPASSRSVSQTIRPPAPGSLSGVVGTVPIARVLVEAAALSGSEVAVVGMVAKANVNILGRNWVHLLDEEGRELIATTSSAVPIGEIVLARGRIIANRALASGYFFPVLLEEASLEPVAKASLR